MNQIAILMATYNGEKYIREQLDSIMNQTFQDFMIYIHDDGSKDGTIGIINEYAQMHSEHITILDYPATGSAQKNFLSMLAFTKEPYIMFSDQDDVWKSEKVERTYCQMQELEKELQGIPICVFTDMIVVDENLKELDKSYFKRMNKNPLRNSVRELLVENVVPGCTCMINAKCRNLSLRYNKIDHIKMHDWWIGLIASACGVLYYLDWGSSFYRQHSHNVVGASSSAFKWIKRILSNLILGKQMQSSKRTILDIYGMAEELGALEELWGDNKSFIRELNCVRLKGKIKRMDFFLRNKLIKRNMKNYWKIILV